MSNLPLFRDPWAKRDAWRHSHVFKRGVMLRSMFPGFGIAVVAFTAYVVVDNLVFTPSKQYDNHPHH